MLRLPIAEVRADADIEVVHAAHSSSQPGRNSARTPSYRSEAMTSDATLSLRSRPEAHHASLGRRRTRSRLRQKRRSNGSPRRILGMLGRRSRHQRAAGRLDGRGPARDSSARSCSANLDPKRIFPVLTKIITAHDWLSVQVHPDDAYAQRVEHQPFGKTECWYVLDAQPNAQIVYGWTRDTSRAEYERRVADGTLGEISRHIDVESRRYGLHSARVGARDWARADGL